MYHRDYKDIAGGGLLALAGAGMAWHATNTLEFGTIARMGPGMFPTSIGVLLVVFGLLIMVPAFFRAGTLEQIEWRSFLAVLASVAVFAVTVRTVGLLPAIIGQVAISTLAEPMRRPLALAAMCVILPAAAYAIFTLGLGLPLTMARWPF